MPARPIRVLEIISGFAVEGPLGGLERFGIELVQALPAPFEPTLLGLWSYGTPTEEAWRQRVEAAGIQALMPAPWDEADPNGSFRATVQATHRALKGQQFDLIHSHCQFGDALALLLQRSLGARRMIRTVHNEREWARRPLRRWLFTNGLALLAFKAEIGVSAKVVANLDKRPLARLLRRRAHLIYNALRLDRFATPLTDTERARYRATLGVPPTARLIGSVGRLDPQKGYSVLIEAMPRVVERFPDAHLVVAGDGNLAAALRQQVAESPVAAHLHLLGPVSPIEPFFHALDLFVSSSLWEGLATVLLEAIAANVPVVATSVSGTTELIEDGESGWLVPPDDAAALGDALIHALSNEALQRTRAASARSVLARFNIEDIAARHAALYSQVLG